ncbi:MAG: fibronectin type III domain-containing protein [Bacteroidetes bacterium]|nr:fibronectin type III domain-containing protein [Bacteroidota bacterium]
MYKKILVYFLAMGLAASATAQSCLDIIGYYPNWQWYDRAQLVKPSTIQYSKYSIINYAFFKPESNGSISSTDTWADENLLLGQINWSTTSVSYYPNTSIIDKAHLVGTKVLPSIGGWTLSEHFPSIASSITKRTLFAHSCCDLIRTYNFDGIDIDWEYPGYTPHNGTLADKANYTLFLQQIRDSLNQLGIVNSKTYLLTTCVGASQSNMLNIEWNNVKNIVDIINLMSYDFFGSWDANANHNSPLFKPLQGDPTFNLDSAVSYLLNYYQVPANKLAAGVAFYGRSAKTSGAPSLFAPITGADNITFNEDDGTPMYYNILKKQNLFTNHWDTNAQVPYLTGNGALHTFVSYDDPQSIALKAQYIKNQNLRGAIIWEITGDYLETTPGSGVIGSTPLIDTLRAVFCNNTSLSLNINPSGTQVICPGQTLTLTASSGFTNYSWNTGDTTQSILVNSSGTYSLTAVNNGNTQTSNLVVVNPLACNVPAGLQLFNTTSTQTGIRWHVTPCAMQYQVRYHVVGASTWQYSSLLSDTSHVLTGLLPTTTYEIQVQSICNSSVSITSAFSTSVLVNTPAMGANQLPNVSIQYPLNNAVFNPGTTIIVQVNATDADGSIQKVKLYSGSVLLGIDSTSSYTFSITLPLSGSVILVAQAFDNVNDSSNSAPIQISLLTAGVCLYPLWNGTSIYNMNDTISYNNILYRAKWWTAGDIPSMNYGNCCVWQYLMPCGGFTASTCYYPNYDSLNAYAANDRVFLNGVVYKAKWWTLNENPILNSMPSSVWMIDTTVSCLYTLQLKLFLEAYYTGAGMMQPVLYNQAIETNPNSMNTDTVQVSLHSAVAPYALLFTQKALLMKDGTLSVNFPSAVSGNAYYVSVQHRNSIETWSANPVVMNASMYDFSTQANKAYGSNQVAVDAQHVAFYCGDLNQDENTDLLDISLLEYEINNFSSGYFAEDINGDGNVDLLDILVVEWNSNQFIYSMHP